MTWAVRVTSGSVPRGPNTGGCRYVQIEKKEQKWGWPFPHGLTLRLRSGQEAVLPGLKAPGLPRSYCGGLESGV